MPFDWKIIDWLGLAGNWRIATFDANAIFVGLIGGVIGLAASEAAYMAEIARPASSVWTRVRWRPRRRSA